MSCNEFLPCEDSYFTISDDLCTNFLEQCHGILQVTALNQESAQLQEAYPESADDISAKEDEIVNAWGNLKEKVLSDIFMFV